MLTIYAFTTYTLTIIPITTTFTTFPITQTGGDLNA